MTNSTVSGNTASIGGGIWNRGPVTLTNSTLSGNSATGHGGGILNSGPGTLTVTNSTLSGNSAAGYGGGILNYRWYAPATLTNSTLSGNSARSGGGIVNWDATATVKNTIVTNSPPGGNCYTYYGTWTSLSHNLSSDGTCASFFTQPSDLNSTDPLLDPAGLKDNGGPTQTIALLEGSPAINHIPVSDCTEVDGMTPIATDQRGVPRPQPQGGNCDIGAYEYQTPAQATEALVSEVQALEELARGIEQALSATLQAALASINQGDQLAKLAAINQLQAFIYQVSALQGVKLTPEQATSLIQAAQQIIQSLSRSP